MSRKINVIIVCGGPSNEREISLKTGEQILKTLPRKRYNPFLLEISKEGKWLLRGGPKNLIAKKEGKVKALTIYKKQEFDSFDVAFIGMHGKFGEDGRVQSLLEMVDVPYTGSGVLASALAMNKIKTLEILNRYGIKTPKFIVVRSLPNKKEIIHLYRNVLKKIGYPCVVKPNESGSSIGISIVYKKEDLIDALEKAFKEDTTVLIEEYVKGLELACAVMGNSGQTELIALPPVEILPANEFFDYDSKYFSQGTQEICPARISKKITLKLQELSKKIHEILGCDGLSRSDFILTPRNQLYFLEINTIPGLTEASLAPKEAVAHGMTFPEFLDKQIRLALLKRKKVY